MTSSTTTPLPSALTVTQRINAVNQWRDTLNPLRGLTIQTVVSHLENAQQGILADLQWAYSFIERRDPDLLALVERRTGALLEMDWNIKAIPAERMPAGVTERDVEAQAQTLRAAYERLENLYEAIEHLAMAAFRGYAHCQLVKPEGVALPGEATRFEILDQWNVARAGYRGEWYWNPSAQNVSGVYLGTANKIDPKYFIIRTCTRPINEIAYVKYVRQNLSIKDWDAFVEIYGVPGCIVILPPNIPDGKVSDYTDAAEDVAEGASGALPNGSSVEYPSEVRGQTPFRPHLDYLTEKLVLAGTGGLLTMLTASGSGTLAGGPHMEAFKLIARADARRVSEVFQKQHDKVILQQAFPGKPILAYFELAAREEKDVGEVVNHAQTLSSAGYSMDAAELSERTGYTLTAKPTIDPLSQTSPAAPFGRMPNRAPGSHSSRRAPLCNSAQTTLAKNATAEVAQAIANDLQPVRKRLEMIMQVEDEQLRDAALKQLQADLPKLLKQINANPESAKAIEDSLAAALLNGMTKGGEA